MLAGREGEFTMANGSVFSELQQASQCELSSSYLIVSSIGDDGLRHSYRISTDDLSRQLFTDYLAASHVKSMAYEQSSDYALTSHDHDIYTSAYWSAAAV